MPISIVLQTEFFLWSTISSNHVVFNLDGANRAAFCHTKRTPTLGLLRIVNHYCIVRRRTAKETAFFTLISICTAVHYHWLSSLEQFKAHSIAMRVSGNVSRPRPPCVNNEFPVVLFKDVESAISKTRFYIPVLSQSTSCTQKPVPANFLPHCCRHH